MNTEDVRCPECMARNGRHGPTCSLMSDEQAREHLALYYKAWSEKEKDIREREVYVLGKVKKANEQRELWKGKWREVKTENNALRKKLNAKTVEP